MLGGRVHAGPPLRGTLVASSVYVEGREVVWRPSSDQVLNPETAADRAPEALVTSAAVTQN